MKLRQMFLALSLIPAIQMSASAQKVFSAGDETGDALSQARPLETVKANAPDAPAAERRAPASETPKASTAAPVPTPLSIASGNGMYADSYKDAYLILREENTCSRFFGGAVTATEVLNRLAGQLRKERLENPNVAMEMSGMVIHVRDKTTGASYRLFERVTVNSIGPLHAVPLATQTRRRLIGRFPSETRAARALILLHEIGHLVQGGDGRWLLPNDGHDAGQSGRNSNTVENYCREQLNALNR